jgi:hypothetical protein
MFVLKSSMYAQNFMSIRVRLSFEKWTEYIALNLDGNVKLNK